MPAKTVTVIPATINQITHMPIYGARKKRVAGYARVSTDKDEQFTSYEAQVDYYTNYIHSHADWDFVKVYTDEGISGLNTKKRDGFNEMVADALDGKIDLIVTKSISRFARNTVDSLVTVRKLKEKGVEVYFEKENIYTLDSKGELLITIMSSLAQEESRSLSENVTWGQRKRFSDGKVSLPYKHFLGYERGEDGIPKIVPEQAEIVRLIYSQFMSGMTPFAIAKGLTQDGIPTPAGKAKWSTSTVESILTNEKYKGCAILQKKFTVDFLTKTMKVNEGEVPQYNVENSHEAIIDPDEWEAVQTELQRRKTLGGHYSGNSPLSARIICGDCGSFYGAKVWHSNSKYRKTIWQCNRKFKDGTKCTTPHLDENSIKKRFLVAFNSLLDTKERLLNDCRFMQAYLTDCSEIDRQIEDLFRELEIISGLTKRCIEENAHSVQNQEEFAAKYNGYVERYDATKAKLETLQKKRKNRCAEADEIGAFMFELAELDEPQVEFDNQLWLATVKKATIQSDGQIVFTFRNGTEVTA
jgi:DNA invertase Pin-like site-specific DNA recombinase